MALPWLRLIDTALWIADFAVGRFVVRPSSNAESRELDTSRNPPSLEARLAGVVVAALKEAFDRDTRRLEFEREQLEAERQRAERALRLEALRQAGARELDRLRLAAGVAAACWIGTLLLSVRLLGGPPGGRIALGAGWMLLLGAVAAAFLGQSSVSRRLAELDPDRDRTFQPAVAGPLALWLTVAGLALVGLAVLTS